MAGLSHRWPLGLSRRTWPLYALGLVVLLAILLSLDTQISRAAVQWPPLMRGFFAGITDYGLSDWILIPSLLVFAIASLTARLLRQHRARRVGAELAAIAAFIFIGVGLPGLLANLLKRAIGRGRPELVDTVGPFGFKNLFNDVSYQSFPSGHATTSFAFALVIGFLWPRLFIPLLVAAIAVSFSRVAIGLHYPSDVLGGAVVGTLGAYAVRNVFAERRILFTRAPDGQIRRRRPMLERWLRRESRPRPAR